MSDENEDKIPNEEPNLTENDPTQDASGELPEKSLAQAVGGAAADYFLKIEGVDGESQDDKHKGEIHLE